jgi:hypothetical protein
LVGKPLGKRNFEGMVHRLKDGTEIDLNGTGCDVKWNVFSTDSYVLAFRDDSGFHYSKKFL